MATDRQQLISLFKEVARLYNQGSDVYRANSFTNAANAINSLPDEALSSNTTKSKLTKYAGIGPSSADSILEYFRTGNINTRIKLAKKSAASKQLTKTTDISSTSIIGNKNMPPVIMGPKISTIKINMASIKCPISIYNKQHVIDLFTTIHGVGDVTANKWYNNGWRTIADVRLHISELTTAQRLGVEYREDLLKRIPREEITRYSDILKHIYSDIVWVIAGSYRRECQDSGDVDLLIQENGKISMNDIIERLKPTGILIAVLSEGNKYFKGIARTQYISSNSNNNEYTVQFLGPARRIDIRLIPIKYWHSALLHYTGSDNFNKQMRVQALSKGWTLSEYGLKDENGDEIPIRSEKDIFGKLGMKYLTPTERNV